MRIEIVILLLGSLLVYNIYTDGYFLKKLMSYKKYFTIGAVILGALFLCWLFRRNPKSAVEMLQHSNEYLKYLPVDGGASRYIAPILDFTLKKEFQHSPSSQNAFLDFDPDQGEENSHPTAEVKITKRSVSESKKRLVAYQQNWLCKKCGEMLPATYEIDHIVRLDRGGTNELSNLAALCPSCHRQKTLLENL